MPDSVATFDLFGGPVVTLFSLTEPLNGSWRRGSGDKHQIPDAHQVVRGSSKLKEPIYILEAAMTRLTHQANRLQPAKDLFHSFAFPLTQLVARMASGALINRTATRPLVVLRYMRDHATGAQFAHKVFRVVSLVAAECHPRLWRSLCDQFQGGCAFARATGQAKFRRHRPAIAVLHQHAAQILEPGFTASRLLIKPDILIGSRLMRLIRAFLAVKVHRRIAGIIRLVIAPRLVLRLKAFQAGPTFDQRAVN